MKRNIGLLLDGHDSAKTRYLVGGAFPLRTIKGNRRVPVNDSSYSPKIGCAAMRKIILTLAVCLFLYGCGQEAGSGVRNQETGSSVRFNHAAFEYNWAAWEAHGVTSYIFEISYFPGEPWIRITVMAGEVVRLEMFNDFDASYEDISYHNLGWFIDTWGTIPQVFDSIEARYESARRRLEQSNLRGKHYSIDVRYNAEFNFPEWVLSAEEGADGDNSLVIRNFQPLN